MIDPSEIKDLQERLTRSDDQTAYVRIYRIYFTRLLHFARSYVPSTEEAEEIVSDIFMHIWDIRRKLNTVRNLTVYLYTAIRNQSINHRIKQKRQATTMLEETSEDIPSTLADPEQYYITSQLVRAIDEAIRLLPPRCQTIFRLVREDGLRYKEVADILDISVKTVEVQIGIAIKKISRTIEPHTGALPVSPFSRQLQKK